MGFSPTKEALDHWVVISRGGDVLALPLEPIARSRATHYASEFGGDVDRSLREDTLPIFVECQYEALDWLQNQMNFEDVPGAVRCASYCRPDEDVMTGDGYVGAFVHCDFSIEPDCPPFVGGGTLERLQREQIPWVKHNFSKEGKERESWEPLAGATEEIGELWHSFLKSHQGIRGSRLEHFADMRDAVGDVVIFLSDFCTAVGIDFEVAVAQTWDVVKRRDFKASPEDGGGHKHEGGT